MNRRILAFAFVVTVALTALCGWYPTLSLVLYSGIVVGVFVANVHGESPAPYLGIAVGIVVNTLVYAAAFSWVRKSRKSSR